MTWLHVALIALAAFTVWEWVQVALPLRIPAYLHTLAVVGLAYGAQHLPSPWLVALAAAGLVGVLHVQVRSHGPDATAVQMIPRRNPNVGRRVPDLP